MVITQKWQIVKKALNQPLLEAQKVTFGYHRQTLLYEVSLSIHSGEMVGLLGPNGSGKTTLLRLFSGVLQPRHGQLFLDGRPLQQYGRRAIAQHLAVVPQELHVPFAFTVKQMVEMGRTPFTTPFFGKRATEDRDLIEESMQATGVANLADRTFNELSGGERQRVMIAMALAQQPEILLLDEPTSHLDIKFQIETLELVQRLNHERGMTIIAALHDLNLAARYFSRLLLFQRGIVADGGPAEVLDPALLSRVYGVKVQVGIVRGSEHLSIIPPTQALSEHETTREATVHVIAGGSSGERVMRALADAGIPFVAGALNIGDSDHTLALRLAEEVITEQPFAPISAKTLEQVRLSLTRVHMLVLCLPAIGSGNLGLLQLAAEVAQQGLPVVIANLPDSSSVCALEKPVSLPSSNLTIYDYTDGKGTECIKAILQTKATIAYTVTDVLEAVKQRTTISIY